MRIPDHLLYELLAFASHHFDGGGLIATPSELGSTFGTIATQWISVGHHDQLLIDLDPVEVVSYCERFGKHLGEFYLNEREG